MTTDMLIAFGGVALIGIVFGAVAWILGAAAHEGERRKRSRTQPGAGTDAR